MPMKNNKAFDEGFMTNQMNINSGDYSAVAKNNKENSSGVIGMHNVKKSR